SSWKNRWRPRHRWTWLRRAATRRGAIQLPVLEPVEVRMQGPAADVLAGDADEVAGEAAGHGVFVGQDRGVVFPAHGAPQLAIARVGEADAVVVDGQAQVHALAVVERVFLLHRPGDLAAFAAHQAQAAARVSGAREEQVVEAVGAVERDQACHLLEVLGGELDAGRGLDPERLLPAGDQALFEARDDALAAVQAQVARAGGEAGHGLVDQGARRLPLRAELRRVEVVTLGHGGPGMRRQVGR